MTYETIPARVTVVGRIDTGDGRPDLIRSEYPAEFTPLEQGFALAYDESEPPAHVTLTCREGYALMERSGVPISRMEFVPGRTLDAAYILPEGEFDMSAACDSLTLKRSAAHGSVRIAYRLFSAGQLMSENRLLVTYTLC